MNHQQARERSRISVQAQPKAVWESLTEAQRIEQGCAVNCIECGSEGSVELMSNRRVYGGQPYGAWPWVYVCTTCGAYVGLHKGTLRALGTLANKATRDARVRAHEAFDPLWRGSRHQPAIFEKRSDAYFWLAMMLRLPFEECHISWFDVELCDRVLAKCHRLMMKPKGAR